MNTVELSLVAVHLAASAAMGGLIWFVQIVHYPLFAAVGPDRFSAYEELHQRRTALVVGPLMGLEVLTAIAAVFVVEAGTPRTLAVTGLVLLAVIHASTIGLQVPRHRALSRGFDAEVAGSLVRTNWIRTTGWTARAVIGTLLLVEGAGP